MSSPVRTPNLCLRCWFYVGGVCRKGPDDYCKILRSK